MRKTRSAVCFITWSIYKEQLQRIPDFYCAADRTVVICQVPHKY